MFRNNLEEFRWKWTGTEADWMNSGVKNDVIREKNLIDLYDRVWQGDSFLNIALFGLEILRIMVNWMKIRVLFWDRGCHGYVYISIPFFQPFGGCRLFEPCYCMNILLLVTPEQKNASNLKLGCCFLDIDLSTQKKMGRRCNHSDCCIIFHSTTWIVTSETARGLWQPRLHQQLFEMLFEPSGAEAMIVGSSWMIFFLCA